MKGKHRLTETADTMLGISGPKKKEITEGSLLALLILSPLYVL
jgi:hypothetical protein